MTPYKRSSTRSNFRPHWCRSLQLKAKAVISEILDTLTARPAVSATLGLSGGAFSAWKAFISNATEVFGLIGSAFGAGVAVLSFVLLLRKVRNGQAAAPDLAGKVEP